MFARSDTRRLRSEHATKRKNSVEVLRRFVTCLDWQNQKAQEALGSERAQIEQRCAELRARVISAEETMLSEQSSRHKLEQVRRGRGYPWGGQRTGA